MLEVVQSTTIHRPLGEVQAQFADVAYHQCQGHHRGVRFRVLEADADRCEYEQETRFGPLRLRQHFLLRQADPAHQVNELLAGPFAPGSITFDIISDGRGATLVTATLRSARPGLTQLAAPLLQRALSRGLGQSLDEDREDLESGTYAAR